MTPSNINSDSAAGSKEEEKTSAVTAAVSSPYVPGAPDVSLKDDDGGKKSHKGKFLYMSSPIRAWLYTEGEIQHRGGPSASGAPIEGLDLGSSAELPENVGASSVALQNSDEVPLSYTDPAKHLLSVSSKKLTLQDNQ